MRGSCFARTPRRPYGHWGERDKTPPRFPDDSAPRNKFNASIGAESQENKMSQLTDARILNESIVDVADQHTILDHIGKKVAIRGKKTRSNSRPAQRKSPVAPLPFETQKSYCNLLARMDGKAIAYSDVHGSDGTVLARLRPAYVKDKFWLRLVPRTDIKRFPSFSWGRLLPIQGTLMKKVTFVPNPNWPQKFSPVPRALLYPFGWSTSLSFMVSRPHSIHCLADFIWFERRLGGDKRSDTQIRCYYNNTFASLVRTRHLQTLLNQASKRPNNAGLDQLVASAVDELSRLIEPGNDEVTSPYYRNAAL